MVVHSAATKVNGTDAKPQPATILLVEDDVLLRLWTADELRKAGFSVVEARHADEAMAILNSPVDIDLVLTDIRMPGSMDGLGLAGVVRERWPELKIIVASGDTPANAALGVADDFFTKPFDAAGIVSRIRKLLGEAA